MYFARPCAATNEFDIGSAQLERGQREVTAGTERGELLKPRGAIEMPVERTRFGRSDRHLADHIDDEARIGFVVRVKAADRAHLELGMGGERHFARFLGENVERFRVGIMGCGELVMFEPSFDLVEPEIGFREDRFF